jgi:hypothetical protein
MSQVKVTDQFTGDSAIYEISTLADSLTVYGMSKGEIADNKALQAALESGDWNKVAEVSASMRMDVELI